jgi:hypothetical protein
LRWLTLLVTTKVGLDMDAVLFASVFVFENMGVDPSIANTIDVAIIFFAQQFSNTSLHWHTAQLFFILFLLPRFAAFFCYTRVFHTSYVTRPFTTRPFTNG